MLKSSFIFVLLAASVFCSCKKESVQATMPPLPPPTSGNRPPVANAGLDQTITLPTDTVRLNGSNSIDPDNNITGYAWTKISGPTSFSIANASWVQTQVTNIVEGTYLFQLKVTDAGGLFSMDTVQVIVNQQANNSLVDIYVTGEQNYVATYWKNGQQVTLKSGPFEESASTSIAVVGTDVYVAGWEGDAFMYGSNIAKYWKNGQEVLLTGETGASATSIAVVGGDVYVAGWEIKGSKTVAKYWKNSQPVTLTDGLTNAEATCIVVMGGNVYVSGHENGVAKYWKNSQPVSLTNGSNYAYANSIAVVGSDVYVAGSESNGKAHVATYWKNGQTVALTNGTSYASASSIAFFGSDVYVGGTEFNGSLPFAKYWKNGQAVPITVATGALASSILVVLR